MSVPPVSPDPAILPRTPEDLERRARMTMMIVFFIVGLSVFLSYDWNTGQFTQDAPITILFGILVGGIIYMVARYGRRGPSYFFPARTCLSCRRIIPADSNLCPYCGQKLR